MQLIMQKILIKLKFINFIKYFKIEINNPKKKPIVKYIKIIFLILGSVGELLWYRFPNNSAA